jgi:N-ethylmaleimide reductase
MKLLSSCSLSGRWLRNRMVMSPMTRERASLEHVPTALMAEYYAQRADAGLIITEATAISADAVGWLRMPGMYTDQQQAGWKSIVDRVHRRGTPIFLQLQHCGRYSHSSYFADRHPPVAPSPIALTGVLRTPLGKQAFETPRALTAAQIGAIVADYVAAARRAQAAGFDGVEITAAFGNLLDTFLQSTTNLRTDRYGGSCAQRAAFLREVIEGVLSVFPGDSVAVRITPNSPINDMGAADNPATFLHVAELLRDYRLAHLHVTDGPCCGAPCIEPSLALAELKAAFRGPLIANGSYTAAGAEAALASGNADLIAFGSLFICNPDLPQRIARGLPLNPPADPQVWYAPGAEGYIDFPTAAAQPAEPVES